MEKFKSKPHEIEAFQFNGDIPDDLPNWFTEAQEKNKIQVTISDRYGKYISVYGDNQIEIAREKFWVCHADHGKIYVLDDSSFKESYEIV